MEKLERRLKKVLEILLKKIKQNINLLKSILINALKIFKTRKINKFNSEINIVLEN